MRKYIICMAAAAAFVAASCTKATASSESSNQTKVTSTESSEKPVVTELNAGDKIPAATDQPVIIDFFATWCGPCKSYAPIFDRAAQNFASQATFVRVDVDKCPDLAAQYNIRSIPTTVILSPKASPVVRVGLIPEQQLRADISQAIK